MEAREVHCVELDYDLLLGDIVGYLSSNKIWVLATSAQDRVTARSVSIVNSGLKIYFQTHEDYLKYKQIRENNRVALCWNNVQVEGIATIAGNPFAPGNEEFIRLYKESHGDSFDRYTKLPGEVVIAVAAELITMWKYIDSVPYIDYLDVDNKKATRVKQEYLP